MAGERSSRRMSDAVSSQRRRRGLSNITNLPAINNWSNENEVVKSWNNNSRELELEEVIAPILFSVFYPSPRAQENCSVLVYIFLLSQLDLSVLQENRRLQQVILEKEYPTQSIFANRANIM
jgi:hypothetical protein